MYVSDTEDYIDDEEIQEESYDEKDTRAAKRRRDAWKHAIRNQNILNNYSKPMKKPLHYYTKNSPFEEKQKKNWNDHDKKQIAKIKNQLEDFSSEFAD